MGEGNPVPHPAKFTDVIMEEIIQIMSVSGPLGNVYDPFAGTGRIHTIIDRLNAEYGDRGDCGADNPFGPLSGDPQTIYWRSYGLEIEPEWASQHPRTTCGNALHPPWGPQFFHAAITSPVYGNRMSDHHNAKDGSKRHTYKHYLGRDLHPDNSGQLQWGARYRDFHTKVWKSVYELLIPASPEGREGSYSGLFLCNVSNHIRKGKEVDVVGWHADEIERIGFVVHEVRHIVTPRQKHGANGKLRVDHESIIIAQKRA